MSAEASSDSGQFLGLGADGQKLVVRFVVILLLSIAVARMMARAWVPGHLIYETVATTLANVLAVTEWQALQIFASGVFGLYLGLLLVFTFDPRKRVQGILLSIGTILGLGWLTYKGIFLANLVLGYVPNLVVFGLSFLAGAIFFEFDRLTAIDLSESAEYATTDNRLLGALSTPRTKTGTIIEFSTAAWLLGALLTGGILLSLAQVILAGVFRLQDILSLATVVLLYQFIKYRVKSDFMLLGPKGSGKTMTMLGMVLALSRSDRVDPDPNSYLETVVGAANQTQTGWPVNETAYPRPVYFQMVVGELFPRRMRLLSWDYPGEDLPYITDTVADKADSSLLSGMLPGGSEDSFDAESSVEMSTAELQSLTDDETYAIVADSVIEADILLLVVDCAKLLGIDQESASDDTDRSTDTVHDMENVSALGTEQYEKVVRNTDFDESIIVATKSDVLFHEEEIESVTRPDMGRGGYRSFKRDVNEYLSERDDVQRLFNKVGQNAVHPVYFETEPDESDEVDAAFVPVRDGSNMLYVGFDELLDEIERAV